MDRDRVLWFIRRAVSVMVAVGLVVGGVTGLAYHPPTSWPSHAIGGSVIVAGDWSGYVLDTFLAMVTPFEERTSVKVRFEKAPGPADAIDVAILPSAARLREMARVQRLVPLDDIVDRSLMWAEYGQGWIDLTTIDGLIHGLVIRAGIRGLAWFDPHTLRAKGYAPPKTWHDLAVLSGGVSADGVRPWCVGPKGTAVGSSAAAWIQAFLLAQAGPAVFDQWVAHRIHWTDAAVRRAWQFLVPPAPGSGSSGPAPAWPADRSAGWADLDSCVFRHRAMLAQAAGRSRLDAATLDFFPLPSANPRGPQPLLIEGDVLAVLNNTPQARALAAYLASVEAHEILARRGGLSPNRAVTAGMYRDRFTRRAAELLSATDVLRADAAELMPRAVYDAFTSGAERFVYNPSALDVILDEIERVAEEAY